MENSVIVRCPSCTYLPACIRTNCHSVLPNWRGRVKVERNKVALRSPSSRVESIVAIAEALAPADDRAPAFLTKRGAAPLAAELYCYTAFQLASGGRHLVKQLGVQNSLPDSRADYLGIEIEARESIDHKSSLASRYYTSIQLKGFGLFLLTNDVECSLLPPWLWRATRPLLHEYLMCCAAIRTNFS